MNASRMTPIQHHALCLAAGGYWSLADALELVARHTDDNRVAAIAHAFGQKACVGYSEEKFEERCSLCCGTGFVECDMGHDHDCPDCDGEGGTSAAELKWKTLDGEEVDASEANYRGGIMMLSDAKPLIAQYTRLIERLKGQGGAA